ncbi:hypothetical protein JCGZ_25962 [Jatropha curcas]|uniref:DUF7806 domain-containing protein n=2 Tax=Jatropha curcas TaxID=180498 RepID=A0A067JE39_JATCU|nr:uncharacterized protein LOC105648317 isoform X3 [Jatropha curcas]KDP22131.1 hypothetical protein JCGZ_25962 [Jatropha curcas]
METLYAKLYNKYDALKKKRISELDELNKDQEVKFLNYVSVAEQLVQHLKDENDKLCAQVSELRSQVTSIRSTKDKECARYQKLFMEEKEKNKMLSEEVEKLQGQLFLSSKDDKNDQVTSGEMIGDSLRRTTRKRSQEARTDLEGIVTPNQSDHHDLLVTTSRKRSRKARTEMDAVSTPGQSYQDDLLVRELAEGSSRGTMSGANLENVKQPEFCRRTVQISANNSSTNCQFQALIEYLLGMKFSTVIQSDDRICISALHQSSGYSFILTWVDKDSAKEPELLYRASTLGTFERVAPEWMRSVLMFSTSMCPIFFERIARVIKMHY